MCILAVSSLEAILKKYFENALSDYSNINKDNKELETIRKQIRENTELRKIIKNTDTEAFIVDNVKVDNKGVPLLYTNKNNFLIKL